MRPLPRHSKIVIERKTQGIYLRIPQPRNETGVHVAAVIYVLLPLLGIFCFLVFAFASRNYLVVGAMMVLIIYPLILLYRLLRPTTPERWVLLEKGFHFDSGVPHLPINPEEFENRPPLIQQTWLDGIDGEDVFKQRQWLYLTLEEVATLRLRHQRPRGNKLLIYHENEPIELAQGVSAKERKWLYDFLKAHYYLGD